MPGRTGRNCELGTFANGPIKLEKGATFRYCTLLRLSQTPPIEVHNVKSAEAPGAIGEPARPRSRLHSPTRSMPHGQASLATG